jgi:hypothetical protein
MMIYIVFSFFPMVFHFFEHFFEAILSDLYTPLSTMARNKENKKCSATLKREATKWGKKIPAVSCNNSEMLCHGLVAVTGYSD